MHDRIIAAVLAEAGDDAWTPAVIAEARPNGR